MIKTVTSFIKKHSLINNKDKIIIGVSGGPDSVYLLILLDSLRKSLSLDLFVAHVNYSLRAVSDKDALFVRQLCKDFQVPYYEKKLKCTRLGNSLEQTARNIRFDYFLSLAKRLKANKIALGHNLDDQAETVLMRIIRGTGLYGLSAILPDRNFSNVRVIRPLLLIKKSQIISYLIKHKIKYRLDKTNNQELFFRNKIRNTLLPLLKEYNPRIEYALINLSNNASLDYELIDSFARISYKRLVKKKTANCLYFKTEDLINIHASLLRMIVRFAYQDLKGDLRRFDYRHFDEIEDLILLRPDNSIVHLPAKISVQKLKNNLKFCFKKAV